MSDAGITPAGNGYTGRFGAERGIFWTSKNKKVAKYKCYQRKDEYWEIDLFTEEDTYFKVSEEFIKDVLRL